MALCHGIANGLNMVSERRSAIPIVPTAVGGMSRIHQNPRSITR